MQVEEALLGIECVCVPGKRKDITMSSSECCTMEYSADDIKDFETHCVDHDFQVGCEG